MGKASKWFRGLLGRKKPDPSSSTSTTKPPQHKRWSLLKSFKDNKDPIRKSECAPAPENDADHDIAVASATAKVVEAAVVSAKAAVVKLTNNTGRVVTSTTSTTTATTASTTADGGAANSNGMAYVSEIGGGYESREEWAAVKIQAHFRAYLSRRALRALKALVRLQALVRGSIQRKENAIKLRRLEQVFLKAQARARAGRSQTVDSSFKSDQFCYPGPLTPEKFEPVRAKSTRRGENMAFWGNCSRSNGNHDRTTHKGPNNSIDFRSWEQQGESSSTRTTARDYERCERILEIDDGNLHVVPRPRNLFHSSHLSFGSEQCSHVLSPPIHELHTISPMKYGQDADEEKHCYYTATSKGRAGNKVGAFTPTKSDGSVSCLSGYSDNPNYMSFTESSKAKMRSLSAPKQRPQQYERSSSTKRCLLQGYAEPRLNNQRVIQSSFFTSRAYPGSGRLDRLGMPVHEEGIGFSGGHWNLY